MDLDIDISPTPNPNALKFTLNTKVKNEGNSNYKTPSECGENNLALALFSIRGVDQVHFFDNSITITKFNYEEWENIEGQIIDCLHEKIPHHDPGYFDSDPEAERRKGLSAELQKIEDILDQTVRPGLQGDGGDLQCLSYEEDVLLVRYQGACGTCPSAATGTLEAIKAILRDQFNENIEVFISQE
ncbi:MAG: NifU family protein [Halobacteriovoraceae bacterium]|nr:NifU family protein [Halobacteriovoraceae bacterium]